MAKHSGVAQHRACSDVMDAAFYERMDGLDFTVKTLAAKIGALESRNSRDKGFIFIDPRQIEDLRRVHIQYTEALRSGLLAATGDGQSND